MTSFLFLEARCTCVLSLVARYTLALQSRGTHYALSRGSKDLVFCLWVMYYIILHLLFCIGFFSKGLDEAMTRYWFIRTWSKMKGWWFFSPMRVSQDTSCVLVHWLSSCDLVIYNCIYSYSSILFMILLWWCTMMME